MKFTHHTTDPFVLDRNRQYEQAVEENYTHVKPDGLWLSVDGDWERYCSEDACVDDSEGNHYRHHTFTHETSFSLDLETVLLVTSSNEMRGFGEIFRDRSYRGRGGVDWARVASQYKGILIAPYLWEMRLDIVEG